jgi:hypothetical protein
MLALSMLALVACNSGSPAGPPRDWSAHPAIAVTSTTPATLFAVSDVHCGFDQLTALLTANGIADASMKWTAGKATLVVVGDLVDKGPKCVEVVDGLMALQVSAAKAGGIVVVTMGNHEAEFLADPFNDKASKSDGFASELDKLGVKPQDTADGKNARGAWLRSLPFAAKIGAWFFAHAGHTAGASLAKLSSTLQNAVDAHGFGDDAIIGVDSILEARDWATPGTAASDAKALGAHHVVIGHDPSAIGAKGTIAMQGNADLFRIDCGMSPDIAFSKGELLRIRSNAGNDVVDALAPDGTSRPLWTGPD